MSAGRDYIMFGTFLPYHNVEPHAPPLPDAPLRAAVRRDNLRALVYRMPVAEAEPLSPLQERFRFLRPWWIRAAGLTESERAAHEPHRMHKEGSA